MNVIPTEVAGGPGATSLIATSLGWLERFAHDVPPGDDWLTESEREVAARHRFAKRLAEWRLGRWTAKAAVSAALGGAVGPNRVEIRAADDGAPEAALDGHPADVAISISHREGVGACLVGPPDLMIGCDLELSEPRPPVFASDYFTPLELGVVRSASAEALDQLVTVIWSAKESALKATRTGLRVDTRSVEVRLEDSPPVGGWRAFRATTDEGLEFFGWWRRTGDLVATVASSAPGDPPRDLGLTG